ncbi:histone acetyltransferase KAT7-like [Convolutriloba macropyga]|uniref:histone acetyltransferase KAT7-like n=1 Tax=Convolutriloba macropyga TaxID=536237 RepID=UPI003F520277
MRRAKRNASAANPVDSDSDGKGHSKRSRRTGTSSASSTTGSTESECDVGKRFGSPGKGSPDESEVGARITRRKSYISKETVVDPEMDKKCFICNETCVRNSDNMILACAACSTSFHSKCLNFDTFKFKQCKSYRWECNSCKKCSCRKKIEKNEKSISCSLCDRKRHVSCIDSTSLESDQKNWSCAQCLKSGVASLKKLGKKENELKCPVAGCDSKGHFSGKFENHYTTSGCPLYHNMTKEEAKELSEKLDLLSSQREILLENISQSGITTEEQIKFSKEYAEKLEEDRKYDHPENIDALVKKWMDHNQQHGSNREALIDSLGITSEWDLLRFRQAQMAVAYDQQKQFEDQKLDEFKIQYVVIGKCQIKTWYSSPYPEMYQQHLKIYICEYCMSYMNSDLLLKRHMIKCSWRHPPGNEIYRKNNLSVFEVDGKQCKAYCQNICLFAKLFLDHKTLYYDVEPFLFYVVTLADNEGCHIVGYFSKEKESFYNYNLSCILTFPQFAKQGYGRFMIEFSYLLSKIEGRNPGTPEKPLSDLGLASYRSYWTEVVMKWIMSLDEGSSCSMKALSQETHVHINDLVSTLQFLKLVKFWRGSHVIVKKQDVIDAFIVKQTKKATSLKAVDPNCLYWSGPPPKSK